MDLIDTHCHLDVAEFAADRDAVVFRSSRVSPYVRKARRAEAVLPWL